MMVHVLRQHDSRSSPLPTALRSPVMASLVMTNRLKISLQKPSTPVPAHASQRVGARYFYPLASGADDARQIKVPSHLEGSVGFREDLADQIMCAKLSFPYEVQKCTTRDFRAIWLFLRV